MTSHPLVLLLAGLLSLASPLSSAHPLVEAARGQIGVTVSYDPAYVPLSFPGGDLPADRGVCTDVVIRAFRTAHHLDLQAELNRDMRANFHLYPTIWGLSRPDPNIDHRRVPNLRTWFTRQGAAVPLSRQPSAFKPGDLVTSTLPRNLPHIMIVSDRTSPAGVPLVIHNIGRGVIEEDCLFSYPINGHFRWPPPHP